MRFPTQPQGKSCAERLEVQVQELRQQQRVEMEERLFLFFCLIVVGCVVGFLLAVCYILWGYIEPVMVSFKFSRMTSRQKVSNANIR